MNCLCTDKGSSHPGVSNSVWRWLGKARLLLTRCALHTLPVKSWTLILSHWLLCPSPYAQCIQIWLPRWEDPIMVCLWWTKIICKILSSWQIWAQPYNFLPMQPFYQQPLSYISFLCLERERKAPKYFKKKNFQWSLIEKQLNKL